MSSSRTRLESSGIVLVVLLALVGSAAVGFPRVEARGPDGSAEWRHTAEVPGFKMMVLINKQEAISFEEYERYFFETHLPYVLAIPGLRGYKVNLRHPDAEDAPYDGISEFWFDDRAAFDNAMESPETAATLEDAARFLMPPQILLVDERVVIPPAN